MKPWTRVNPTTQVSGEFRSIITKTFRLPNGKIFSFDTYDAEDTHHAGAIALTKDRRVLVVRQFRPGPESIMDEIPGGTVESGEEPKTAVLRELEEETGYTPGNLEYLGEIRKDAYMNATWHYFLATDCTPNAKGQHLDSREQLELRLITIDELLENARTARMTDAEAVLLAYEKLQELKEQR